MRVLTVMSLVLALAVSTVLLVTPSYSSISTESVVDPASGSVRRSVTEGHRTLLDVNGPRVLLPLGFPVLVALVPLLFPLRALRVGAAVLLGGFCILGALSVGWLYLPSAARCWLPRYGPHRTDAQQGSAGLVRHGVYNPKHGPLVSWLPCSHRSAWDAELPVSRQSTGDRCDFNLTATAHHNWATIHSIART